MADRASRRRHKLSDNERKVLKALISDGRTSCTEIAKRLRISPQAVGKIKDKLEAAGVIKGYAAIVDLEKIGVEVICIGFFRFKSGSWTRLENEDIRNRVKGHHLIRVYRLSEGDVTHMVIYGFRSLRELDNYFHVLQAEREHVSELRKLYILSVTSILKDSPNELFAKILDEHGSEKHATPEPFV